MAQAKLAWELLAKAVGNYTGKGVNHEGQNFSDHFSMSLLHSSKTLEVSATAVGDAGEVYHSEKSWLGFDLSGALVLFVTSNNHPGVTPHPFHRIEEKPDCKNIVFRFGNPDDRNSFREEITFSLFSDGSLAHGYAWGLPGGEFEPRSSAKMSSRASTEPSMFDPVVIDTEHVKIRPLHTVTWQKLAEGLLYEGSFHATNWGIKSPQDVQKMYENGIAAFQNKRGNPIVFLNQDETEVLGMTNFMNVEPANKMIEIGGTWINKKYQRSFVNTETKFALLQYAFENLKLNRVEFRIDSENMTSQRAVQRLGFQYDGLMSRRKINANGDTRDYVYYSVTDLDWPLVKNQIQQIQEKSKLPEFEVLQKIKIFRREGHLEQAFASALTGIIQFPNSPDLQYLAACLCDAYRTEAEAVPFYVRALDLGLSGLDRRDAFLGLASTYRSLGKYEESKLTFEKGLSDFPNYRPYQVFLALTEFNLNAPESSIKRLLEQLIETSSDQEIRSYEKALKFYSTRLSEVFE